MSKPYDIKEIKQLLKSFREFELPKVSITTVGRGNVGKSTSLNDLLGDKVIFPAGSAELAQLPFEVEFSNKDQYVIECVGEDRDSILTTCSSEDEYENEAEEVVSEPSRWPPKPHKIHVKYPIGSCEEDEWKESIFTDNPGSGNSKGQLSVKQILTEKGSAMILLCVESLTGGKLRVFEPLKEDPEPIDKIIKDLKLDPVLVLTNFEQFHKNTKKSKKKASDAQILEDVSLSIRLNFIEPFRSKFPDSQVFVIDTDATGFYYNDQWNFYQVPTSAGGPEMRAIDDLGSFRSDIKELHHKIRHQQNIQKAIQFHEKFIYQESSRHQRQESEAQVSEISTMLKQMAKDFLTDLDKWVKTETVDWVKENLRNLRNQNPKADHQGQGESYKEMIRRKLGERWSDELKTRLLEFRESVKEYIVCFLRTDPNFEHLLLGSYLKPYVYSALAGIAGGGATGLGFLFWSLSRAASAGLVVGLLVTVLVKMFYWTDEKTLADQIQELYLSTLRGELEENLDAMIQGICWFITKPNRIIRTENRRRFDSFLEDNHAELWAEYEQCREQNEFFLRMNANDPLLNRDN